MSASDRTRRPLVLGSIMLAMFMIAIEATIVGTAMPAIVARLGGFSLYSWVFAAFLLTQAATIVMFGKLADLYGRRPILIAGIVVFLIGSTLCGFAWSMPSLIVFRLIQGLGAGSIQPVTMTVVGDLYSPQERASIQGYLSSVWGISAIVGPFVGGVIVDRFSWPWVFWINLPIGLATILGLSLFLHEDVAHRKHAMDYLGAALFAAAVTALLLLLSQGSGPVGIVSALVFVVSLALFFRQERRAPEPMLDLKIWTDQLIASANGASMVAGMTLMGITTFLAVYVQGVMGRSATVAGLALTMMAVGWPIASVLARRFYDGIGMRATLRLGAVLMIVGAAVLLFLAPESSPFLAGLGSAVIGFGMGLLVVTCVILIQGSVSWSVRGSATASNVFARTLGSTLGATALGAVLNFRLAGFPGVTAEQVQTLLKDPGSAHGGPAQHALDVGLHATFWAMVVLAVVTLALSLLVPHRHLHELEGGAAVPAGE
jgi:EmrB/QacA subfamily drug resistance transporter